MQLLTNPSSNVPESALAHYDVLLARQQIVVNHVSHDTRRELPLSVLDGWVGSSRDFPKVVGSTTEDLVPVFLQAIEKDPELLVVVTSKRLITTYHSAQAAAAKVKARAPHAHIQIVDTLSTDLGAGLQIIAAGEAKRAGRSMKDIVTLLTAMSDAGRAGMHVHDLTNVMKSGRSSLLRAWSATLLQVRPMMGIADGDLRVLGRIRTKDDPVLALANYFSERIANGRRIWLGVAHGGDPALAARCLAEFGTRFDVAYSLTRPLSSSTYLYMGRGALAVFVIPVDDLPWALPTPPSDAA